MEKQKELFLEIQFHDNDFSNDFVEVLVKIWKMIRDNNSEHHIFSLFQELYDKEMLLPMIKKAVILSAAGHDIEWATRMYQGKCTPEILKSASSETKRFEIYFSKLKIKLHTDDKFIKNWKNSEHAALNCRNGNVIIF